MPRKSVLLSTVVALFPLFAPAARAQDSSLDIVRDSKSPRGNIRLLVTSTPPASGCSLRLTYAPNQRAASRPLLTLPDADGLFAVLVSSPPRLRKRTTAILRAERICGNDSDSSFFARVAVRKTAKGLRSLKGWARAFRNAATISRIQLTQQFPEERFAQLTDLQSSPAMPDYVFVLEQSGRVSALQPKAPEAGKQIVLDVSALIRNSGEQGLLGLAFHPQLTANPYLFVNYVEKDTTDTIIARYTLTALQPPTVDAASRVELIRVDQPFPNHNGGQLAFGPDGFLYIGLGDGGSGGDPLGHGQDATTVLGSMLRIDVNSLSPGRAYGIPSTNPFVGNSRGIPEETYAYGFRNPWRYSFDSATGELWLADVGQNTAEEIDIVRAGRNYGWNIMEGRGCFSPPSGCDTSGLELPVHEYTRELGESITGGYVYRGPSAPTLRGHYIYADFVSGRVWALVRRKPSVGPQVIEIKDTDYLPSSFGVDVNQDLYLLDYEGSIFKLEETAVAR